jgi:PAS domain-containing protein
MLGQEMNKIVKWLKGKLCKYNPFYLHTPHLDKFIKDIDCIRKDVQSVQESIKKEKELLEQQLHITKIVLSEKEAILETIIETIPDMVWYKDIDGRYIYANAAIKKGLLCSNFPEGKNDVELAQANKNKYGDENHTFGEKCSNSDLVVIEKEHPCRFVENGYVRGEWLELEVNKNVVKNKDGEIIGTVGTGRDITEYVELQKSYENLGCAGECGLKDIFAKNRYGDGQ